MNNQFTLIIILHNRHSNLDRLLEFYSDSDFPILIADSSAHPHHFEKEIKMPVQYIYDPGVTYTQKIERILAFVRTPYVAMCADDDFLITGGLKVCVDFLNEHPGYTSAQGIMLKYYKDTIPYLIRFDNMYNGHFSIEAPQAEDRIRKLFDPYKSLLYGVHKTEILKQAFNGAGNSITNLYLNEYLVSIVPVLYGQHKDLNVLYQVREYADISDDKTTENIDVILKSKSYENEFNMFMIHVLSKIPETDKTRSGSIAIIVREELEKYANEVVAFKKEKKSLKKDISKIVFLLPFFGPSIIRKRRFMESASEVKKIITDKELQILEKIEILLKKYEN